MAPVSDTVTPVMVRSRFGLPVVVVAPVVSFAPAAATAVTLAPAGRQLVPTGLRVAIPDGYAGLVLPRSGLALRTGVTVLNAPGLIDSGYRGEIGVLLVNHGAEAVTIGRGERIAQLVIQPVARASLVEVRELGESRRGTGGFGSTGV